ncbi:ABC transporter permease [Microbacterium atlanticum]|uniref:ABC transporter permease n=1 Tax=Microbacterium atlanticum TaxID=2782168 RepID=UPI001887EAA7|nr:ABC transporter permease [Microbacterium atlanticum]
MTIESVILDGAPQQPVDHATTVNGGDPGRPSRRRSGPTWVRRLFRTPSAIISLVFMALIVLGSTIGPLIYPRNPIAAIYPPLLPPSVAFPLGTDQLGRDFLARVLAGGSVTVFVGIAVALLCLTIGLVIGAIAGFYGGPVDMVLTKVVEFFQVIPALIIALVASYLLGASVPLVVGVLAITMWPQVARIARAEARRISTLGYVESARAAGFSQWRVLVSEAVPNMLPPVIVSATMTAALAILTESGLSFIGLTDPQTPSWGSLLSSAQPYMQTAWWLAVVPGLLIFLIVLAVNGLGETMNDILNPTLSRVKS